jgi:hypothetical protein
MAGTTIRVLEKNTYTLVSTQTGTYTFPAAINVDVSRFAYVSLVTRVHAFSNSGSVSAPTVVVNGYPSAPTAEDPSTLFRFGTAKISSVAISGPVSSGAFTPAVDFAGGSANAVVGGLLDLLVSIAQSSTAGNLSVSVSIDLVLKS